MATFELLTERRLIVEADDEGAARSIALGHLGAGSNKDGVHNQYGKYAIKIFPGCIRSAREIRLEGEAQYKAKEWDGDGWE